MAVDMFLKLNGIAGEASDDKHKGEIDVLSWSWGATQTGTSHVGGGAGAGKANVHDINVVKYVDKSTPILLTHCLSGKHIPDALLIVRKAGGNPLEYIKVAIKDVLVSSVQTGGSGHDERLTETIALNFASVKYDYVPQKKDGSGDAPVPMTWDVAANKA